jgi:hypothetical protein
MKKFFVFYKSPRFIIVLRRLYHSRKEKNNEKKEEKRAEKRVEQKRSEEHRSVPL